MAPQVNVEHLEAWSVAITPGEGDPPWPDVPDRDTAMRPDLILLYLRSGQPAEVSGSGRRYRRDGSPGSLRVNAPWRVLDDLPDWARVLVRDTLSGHDWSGTPWAEAGNPRPEAN